MAIGSLFWFQDKMLYIPEPDPIHFPRKYNSDPGKFRNLPFDNVFLETHDGEKLFGWFIKQKEPKNFKTILYLHANAGGIGNRLPYYSQFYNSLNVNVMAAEYRGFGNSSGVPSEEGLKIDSLAFYEYLKKDNEKIIVFGRSLGGAVAINLVSELEKKGIKVDALILENTFTNIKTMATKLLPFLKPFEFLLKKPILKNEWDSLSDMKYIKKTPLLMFSGRSDELVPPEMMDKLWETYKLSADPVVLAKSKFVPVPTGTHNDTPFKAGQSYITEITNFLSKL